MRKRQGFDLKKTAQTYPTLADSDLFKCRNKPNVQDWVRKIDESISRQRLTVYTLGDLLLKAEAELTKEDFLSVIKLSGLKSKQNAQNYMRVARHEFLRRPGIVEYLPTTVGALIDLAAWSVSEIQGAIRDGVLHPQSERVKLRKWRVDRWCPPAEKPADTARVVGYIMCDAQTHDFGRTYDFWEKFDEIKLNYLDGDMFITPFEDDVTSFHRMEMLAKRVWEAYKQDPALFVDPRFHKLVEEKALANGNLTLYMAEIARLLASGDHIALHRVIRFSKSDWKFLSVDGVGYASLLSYFVEAVD
jgi:hypothetical protein